MQSNIMQDVSNNMNSNNVLKINRSSSENALFVAQFKLTCAVLHSQCIIGTVSWHYMVTGNVERLHHFVANFNWAKWLLSLVTYWQWTSHTESFKSLWITILSLEVQNMYFYGRKSQICISLLKGTWFFLVWHTWIIIITTRMLPLNCLTHTIVFPSNPA